ncbi:MAG: caspase family protein [Muribaculaceae bacterium]|nr:caspase family protein [Muribaculaceae bacterium]
MANIQTYPMNISAQSLSTSVLSMIFRLVFLITLSVSVTASGAPTKTGKDIETIVQAAHFIEDFDISPDGKYAVTCNNNSVALWDIDMRRMIKRISIPTKGKVRFDPLKPEIVYISDPGNLTGALRANPMCVGVNVMTGERTGSIPESELEKRNSYHDRYIFKLKDGKIEISSRKDKRPIGRLDGNFSTESGRLDISPNDSLVALGGPAPLVWDIRNAKIATIVPYSSLALRNSSLAIDKTRGLPVPASRANDNKRVFHYGYLDFTRCKFADENNLYVGGYADDMTVWDLSGSSTYVDPILSNTLKAQGSPIYDFVITDTSITAASYSGLLHGAPEGEGLAKVSGFTPSNDYLGVYCITPDSKSGYFISGHENSRIMKASLDNPLDKKELAKTGHAVHHLTIAPDGKTAIGGGQMGTLFEIPLDGEGSRFDYNTNSLQLGVMQGSEFLSADRFATICKDGSVSFWTRGVKDMRKNIPTHLADTYGIGLTSDGRHLITSDAQGSLRFWNPQTEELTMSAFPINDRKDYIFITPDNYYKASKGIHSAVHFSKGLEVYPFEQFDLRLNRPDIILERLGASSEKVALYHEAWLKRLRKMGFTEKELTDEIALPTVALLNERELDNLTEASAVNVNFSVSDPTHTLKRVFVNLNGVPLLGRNGKDISAQKLKKYTSQMNIDLSSGENTIEIFAINSAGAESLRKTIEIQGKGNPSNPNLYIVAIGVSEYNDKDYNLNYAAKDAEDIAALFKGTQGNFSNIEELVLTNAQFTPASLATIKNFVMKAKRDDTVVLFYAGHGLLDDQLNYYLSHSSINFANPAANGIPYEKFEAVLDGTKALNRLVMIDACHSGEIDKEDFVAQTSEVSPSGITFRSAGNSARLRDGHGVEEARMLFNELFMDIRWGSGATVVSSSGGLEVAFEGDEWNNGLFTWCLKNGLASRKADLNSDGSVSSTELGEYLCDEVARLSDRVQIPTLRTQNTKNDFILVR